MILIKTLLILWQLCTIFSFRHIYPTSNWLCQRNDSIIDRIM